MVRLLDPVYETTWFGGVVPPYAMYQERAALLAPVLSGWGVAANAPILVVGAAYGSLLRALMDVGYSNPWGVDGQYSKSRSNQEVPLQTVRDRIGVADATSEAAIRDFKMATAGLGRNARFAATIIEDVESTLTGATEVAAMHAALRAHTTAGRIVHLITMYEPDQPWSSVMSAAELNNGYYQAPAAWLSLIRDGSIGAATEPVYNLRTMTTV